jgi:hypothetical protein
MKGLLFITILLLLCTGVQAQLGDRYFHSDSIAITTVEVDTSWDTSWEVATIMSDTLDLWLKLGAPDVGSWASRNWFKLEAGMALTIGPTPKLKRMSVKCTNGSGYVYVIGYKKARQY